MRLRAEARQEPAGHRHHANRRRHDGVPRTPLHLRDPRPRVPGPILGRVLLQRRARSGSALLQGLREAVLRLLACPFLTPARYARRPPGGVGLRGQVPPGKSPGPAGFSGRFFGT